MAEHLWWGSHDMPGSREGSLLSCLCLFCIVSSYKPLSIMKARPNYLMQLNPVPRSNFQMPFLYLANFNSSSFKSKPWNLFRDRFERSWKVEHKKFISMNMLCGLFMTDLFLPNMKHGNCLWSLTWWPYLYSDRSLLWCSEFYIHVVSSIL